MTQPNTILDTTWSVELRQTSWGQMQIGYTRPYLQGLLSLPCCWHASIYRLLVGPRSDNTRVYNPSIECVWVCVGGRLVCPYTGGQCVITWTNDVHHVQWAWEMMASGKSTCQICKVLCQQGDDVNLGSQGKHDCTIYVHHEFKSVLFWFFLYIFFFFI